MTNKNYYRWVITHDSLIFEKLYYNLQLLTYYLKLFYLKMFYMYINS